jgi:hypothetical protein
MEDYPYLFGPDKTVTFLTNTNWKFTTDASYADVIGSSGDIVAGAMQTTAASPTSPVEESVTFSESSTVIDPGLKSTIVTFHTVTPDGITDDEKSVEFRRDVPVIFSVTPTPASGSVILAKATSVTLDVAANLPWWRRLDNGAKQYPAYPTNSAFTVDIPERSTTVAASWNNTATVTVRAGYDEFNEIPALDPVETFTFTRPAYTLSASGITPTTVPSVKGTVTADFASTADTYQVIWKDATGTAIGSAITVNGEGLKSVPYPGYTNLNGEITTQDRILYLYNAVTNTKICDEPVTQLHPLYFGSHGYWEVVNGKSVYRVGTPYQGNTQPCPAGYTLLADAQYPGLDMSRAGWDITNTPPMINPKVTNATVESPYNQTLTYYDHKIGSDLKLYLDTQTQTRDVLGSQPVTIICKLN